MSSHSPILDAIFRHAAEIPAKPAVVDGNVVVTYSGLADGIRRAASALSGLGVRRGDRVAISAQKGTGYVFFYFASQFIGAVNVVVDAQSSEGRLRFVEAKTRPVVCLGYSSPDVRSFGFDEIDFSAAPAADASASADASPDDVAEILFTTGTTGEPKGVCLSHANIFASASNINSFIGNTADDVEVLALPICHSFGLGRLRCCLVKGATIVLLGSFANLPLFFRALERHQATGFGMVPAAWAYIRKVSGSRIAKFAPQIRYIEIGSAAMPRERKEELAKMFPDTRICHHYGLTEASRAAFMEYHADATDLNTIGREVCAEVSIRVFDEGGRPQPDGTPGEICVRGNMVMKGYLDRGRTDVDFFGEYFRTGDIGWRSPDGRLYLAGRKKELINVGGRKASPSEIEDAAISLGVEDCICAAAPDPEGILGEVPKLYILRNGTSLSFDELKSRLSGVLEPYKVPVMYEWIDEIPKTASGKKQRLQLSGRMGGGDVVRVQKP